jgi:hypothetical protein
MARLVNSYKIEIINWDKHNAKSTPKYPHFMISKTIFNDHKVSQLTPTEFVLMIFLFAVRSDSMSSEFTVNYKQVPSQLRLRDESLLSALTTLQSLQILTFEKVPLNKEISNINSNNFSPKNSEAFSSSAKHNDFLMAQEFRTFLKGQNLYGRLKMHIAQIAKDWGTVESLKNEMNRLFNLEIIADKSESEKIDFVVGKLIKTAKVEL